ncbi:MAG: NAD(P)-dependent oxidoreductase [Gammaproteobacteria bacterium]|nr:NAD(P)-dependent oxidoreductase [Gammaproteobacteria bacterium]
MNGDCIVFGGAGFLGGEVARQLLEAGAEVVVADLPAATERAAAQFTGRKIRYENCDVRDRESMLRLARRCPRGAWVVNLAVRQYANAPPRRGRLRWISEVNVDGALNVCHFARESGAAGLVQFSTDMVYGAPRELPVGEDHPFAPIGEYGASKARMEREVRAFARANDLPATFFRPRLITGAGRLGIFEKLFKLIRRNLPVPLIGAGKNHYQMIALRDCAAAVPLALAAGCPNAAYNLGSEPSLCVRDLLRQLCREVGSKSPLLPTPAPLARVALRALAVAGAELLYPEQYHLADKHIIVDTARARRDLNWKPLHDDLSMMIAAYEHWRKRA